MRIRIISQRSIFLGFDESGNRVNGTPGQQLGVPKDLSERSANVALRSGLAVKVEEKPEPKKPEKKETATKAASETATKAPPKRVVKKTAKK
jgi:hypothetical protein